MVALAQGCSQEGGSPGLIHWWGFQVALIPETHSSGDLLHCCGPSLTSSQACLCLTLPWLSLFLWLNLQTQGVLRGPKNWQEVGSSLKKKRGGHFLVAWFFSANLKWFAEPASWAYDLYTQGPICGRAVSLTLCCLKILNKFLTKDPVSLLRGLCQLCSWS